jgi:hypothetical protein
VGQFLISSGNYGYLGDNASGVLGYSSSDYGVRGLSISGYGTYGKNIASDNFGYLGSDSFGVYGKYNTSGNYGYLGSDSFGVYGFVNGPSGNGVYGRHESSNNFGFLGGKSWGVYGQAFSSDGYGVYGYNSSTDSIGYLGGSNGVHGYSGTGYAGYFSGGGVYVTGNVSADSFTDRTTYPKDIAAAYEAVMSMERLPDGQYDEKNREVQLDHSKLSDFIKSKDGNRDLSATVSAHNEVLKHLIRKNDELEKAYIHIEQLNKRIIALEAKLVKLEAGLNIVQ